jgi:hypothetical protein
LKKTPETDVVYPSCRRIPGARVAEMVRNSNFTIKYFTIIRLKGLTNGSTVLYCA